MPTMNNVQWAIIEPEDVLMFRDSRPFDAGTDFRAEGNFPPLPTPIAGALRTAILRKNGATFADYADPTHSPLDHLRSQIGTADSMGNLQLYGVFLCRFVPGQLDVFPEILFPAPADLIGGKVPHLHTTLIPGLVRCSRLPGIAVVPSSTEGTVKRKKNAGSEWLVQDQMYRYLLAENSVDTLKVEESPFDTELQIGIEHSAESRSTVSGHFYAAQVNRMRSCVEKSHGLLVGVQGASLTDGYLHLGGERRCAYLRPLTGVSPVSPVTAHKAIVQAIHEQHGRFRVVLATPGIFGMNVNDSGSPVRGETPQALLVGEVAGVRFDLFGATLGKPISIGGWNLATNAPRPLRRALPAGAVYYGKIQQPDEPAIQALVNALHFTTYLQQAEPSDAGEAKFRGRMGFGLSLIGTWYEASNETTEEDTNR